MKNFAESNDKPPRGQRLHGAILVAVLQKFSERGTFIPKKNGASRKRRCITPEKWSGRRDLNPRPLGPEPSALAKLRYVPTRPFFKPQAYRDLPGIRRDTPVKSPVPSHDGTTLGPDWGGQHYHKPAKLQQPNS